MSSLLPPKPLPKRSSFRNFLDRYPTSTSAMSALISELENFINREMIACFADICGASTDCVSVLMQQHFANDLVDILTNDIDSSLDALSHLDAADPNFPKSFAEAHPARPPVDVIVTSPPYSLACPILRNALSMASKLIAMKLPSQFLNPHPDRVRFLCPGSGLQHVIIMSREAAGGAAGRLTTYSTEAWLVWDTSRRGAARAQHSEPHPTLTFVVTGTRVCPLQTSSTPFTYSPASERDPSHITLRLALPSFLLSEIISSLEVVLPLFVTKILTRSFCGNAVLFRMLCLQPRSQRYLLPASTGSAVLLPAGLFLPFSN
jgi:hypothetical protein